MPWSREFDAPIVLDDGRELITLRDAAKHVMSLSKAEQDKDYWQTAVETLLMAGERGGIVMLAEIAMRQALAHGKPEMPRAPRKKAAKKYKVIR